MSFLKYMTFRKNADEDGFRQVPAILEDAAGDPFFVEQFKALRAKVEHWVEMHGCRVIAVTSAVAGEGKTLIAATLAQNLGAVGRRRILLVDADLRKSDLAKRFGIEPLPGLSEHLDGGVPIEAVIRRSVMPGLNVVPGGERMAAPGDLLAGDRFRAFIDTVRTHHDLVILDTPPVIPVADALNLKERVERFIFVFRAAFTPHTLFRQAVEEIGEKSIIGVVINGVESQKEIYYKRYYGKYYTKSGPSRPSR